MRVINNSDLSSLQALRYLYQLKSISRANSLNNRKESTAEHTWSTLVLAGYFYESCIPMADLAHVYELLIYHDVAEIPLGDTPLDPNKPETPEPQLDGISIVSNYLPDHFSDHYKKLANEFDACQTLEARYANAIDKLDPIIHELDYIDDWKGWSEDFLRKKKEKYFIEFPVIHRLFNELMIYMTKEGYFST